MGPSISGPTSTDIFFMADAGPKGFRVKAFALPPGGWLKSVVFSMHAEVKEEFVRYKAVFFFTYRHRCV